MIQSDFSGMVSPIAVRFSGGQFCLGVETLDNPTGKLFLGPEPVQQQRSMSPQHLGYFLHGVNLRAHGLGTPCIQKLSRPVRRDVRPEELELFLQKVTPPTARCTPTGNLSPHPGIGSTIE